MPDSYSQWHDYHLSDVRSPWGHVIQVANSLLQTALFSTIDLPPVSCVPVGGSGDPGTPSGGLPVCPPLWSALTPIQHPDFVQFVCPVVSRSERRLVELCLLFFHAMWKLSRRRRFSSDPLEPIAETAFEELRASIQESKGRVVSL